MPRSEGGREGGEAASHDSPQVSAFTCCLFAATKTGVNSGVVMALRVEPNLFFIFLDHLSCASRALLFDSSSGVHCLQ